MDISIVVPVYNEEGNLAELVERIKTALSPLTVTWEAIFVDDGSTDGSAEVLRKLAAEDERIKLVVFRRNFGQTSALAAGFRHASGDVIITMDADLQNDPADIPRLLEKLNEGYDIVSGWRKDRKDDVLTRKIPSRAANWLISVVTGVHLHDYGCTLKAYRREVIENINLYGEMHRFLPALGSLAGARVAEIPVAHHPRTWGRTKYGLTRTLKVVLDLLTVKFLGEYSTKPIYVFGGLGLVLFIGAVVSGTAVIIRKIAFGGYMIETPLLLLTVLLLILSAQFVLMGLVAEMITRTYHESQDKPTYVIKETVNFASEQ